MAFQLSYVFEFVDRYSKVAEDMRKKVKNIDAAILGTTKNFKKFGADGQENLKKVRKATREAAERTKSFTRQTKKQTRAMKAMGAVAGNLKFRIASLLVTMGMTGFGFTFAARKAMDFQDVLKEMQALTGATGKDLEFLKNKAWLFGKQFGKSGADAMTGIKQTADAFPALLRNIPGLVAMTKEAMVLSTAAGMTVPDSVKALNAVLNIFDKDASEAKDVINKLAAGALLSNVMTEQLTHSIIRGGGAAKATGVSFERYIALTNALGSSEIKAQKAGTAMNMMLIKLMENQINVGDETRKLSDIIREIKSNYEAAGDAGIAYLRTLVTARHIKGIMAWFANLDKLDAWEKGVQGTNEAYRQAGVRLGTLRVEFERMGTAMSEKFWKFFEKIEPSLIRLTRSFKTWIESITDVEIIALSNAVSGLVNALTDLAEILGILVSPIRGILWLFGKMETVEGLDAAAIEAKIKKFKLERGIPITGDLGLESPVAAGTPGAAGKVDVNVNLRGNTDAVESATATSEGDVNFNMGPNFAY
jgi:TP901 family phage tail tape measure protein